MQGISNELRQLLSSRSLSDFDKHCHCCAPSRRVFRISDGEFDWFICPRTNLGFKWDYVKSEVAGVKQVEFDLEELRAAEKIIHG